MTQRFIVVRQQAYVHFVVVLSNCTRLQDTLMKVLRVLTRQENDRETSDQKGERSQSSVSNPNDQCLDDPDRSSETFRGDYAIDAN